MNFPTLQLDINYFNTPSQYHRSHYPNSSSPLCSSMSADYSSSSILQTIEDYYPPGPYSSETSFCPSSIFQSDDFLPPSSIILPQNHANYTRHHLVMLNEIFKEHKYPNSLQKTLITKHVGVSHDQIRIWFQNKRRKIQLINKGQAKQTKTDIECEYGEYQPKNFFDDFFQELDEARTAPAR